jgi:N-formylglutamate deformylase
MIIIMKEADESARAETLEPADLGLDPATPLPFAFTPAARWSPLVISFPHVGLDWPEDDPHPRPAVNFARNADFAVDHLYPDAAELGAASVRARYSRLLVDLNRAADDVSAALIPDHPAPRPQQPPWATTRAPAPVHNRGLIWQTAVGNVQILRGPLPFAALQARLRRYYDPYHRALEVLLRRRCERFGHAVLLDAHSMPSSVAGDLVLGTFEGGACSSELEQQALAALSTDPQRTPLALRLNDPYRGGELVRRFGRPEHGVHALQLEVNRALYMDEASLTLRPEIVAAAAEIRPAGPASRSATARPPPPVAPRESPAAPAAAPLALLHRVKSLVQTLATATPKPAAQPVRHGLAATEVGASAGQPSNPEPRGPAHFGEPLCRRRPRG